MKLKKIASLALAGVMAVSMLAGCAGKTGTTEDGTTVVVTGSTAVAQAFNDAQETVTFSYDSKLESKVAQTVKTVGENAAWDSDIKDGVTVLTGNGVYSTLWTKGSDVVVGDTKTQLYGFDLDSDDYWTETDAINAAARKLEETVADLKADTKSEVKKEGDKYYEFSYTGSVAMVATKTVTGTTTYHFVYTISQTAAEKEYTRG